MLEQSFTCAMKCAKEQGYFNHQVKYDDNNMTARGLMAASGCHDMLYNMTTSTPATGDLQYLTFHNQAGKPFSLREGNS